MPKRLYYRAAFILVFPVVFLQLIVSIVFIQRHFEGVTVQMTRTVAAELDLITEVIERDGAVAAQQIARSLGMSMSIVSQETEFLERRRVYDLTGLVVRRELLSLPEIFNVDLPDNRKVNARIKSGQEYFDLQFSRRRVSASNPHQLIVYLLVFGAFFTVIAFFYLRNQLRPITRLADAAEAFGLGENVPYDPSGALEVRAAGQAFLDMRERIQRHLKQRTMILSGVSHDLRTPLTRLKLGLSFLPKEQREPLEKDVEDMNLLLNEFLDFAKQDNETDLPTEDINPTVLVNELIENFRRTGIQIESIGEIGNNLFKLKPFPIKRALENLINNADRYGKKILIEKKIENNFLIFSVHDDGPGIDEAQYDEVLQPFTRLDPSRNQNKGSGVGLGLPIAKEIAEGQGGSLKLSKSDILSGLNAALIIPINF
ncbi:MAG: two-component sensor histidine kinase [Rhodobacterales bacterium]|nr:MAG: two-component sensor histidine kinase [Rhodobacterales bacterium]